MLLMLTLPSAATHAHKHRLLRQRSSMLPTLVGRSSRQALLAFRAMNHTFALFGAGEYLANLRLTECD
jgi:hypothetical protein